MTTAPTPQSRDDRLAAREIERSERHERARSPDADERAPDAANEAEQPALEHRGAHERRAVRAKRARDREFLLTLRRPCEQQRRDVDHQHQHQKDSGKAQDQQARGAPPRHQIGFETLRVKASRRGSGSRARRWRGRPRRPPPSPSLVACRGARESAPRSCRRWDSSRRGSGVECGVRVGYSAVVQGSRCARRRSGGGITPITVYGCPVSHTVPPDHPAIRAQPVPQFVRQHDHRCAARTDFVGQEAAAQRRAHAKQIRTGSATSIVDGDFGRSQCPLAATAGFGCRRRPAAPSITPPAFCSSATSVPPSQPRFRSKIFP